MKSLEEGTAEVDALAWHLGDRVVAASRCIIVERSKEQGGGYDWIVLPGVHDVFVSGSSRVIGGWASDQLGLRR